MPLPAIDPGECYPIAYFLDFRGIWVQWGFLDGYEAILIAGGVFRRKSWTGSRLRRSSSRRWPIGSGLLRSSGRTPARISQITPIHTKQDGYAAGYSPPRSYVFISHAGANTVVAREFVEILWRNGLDVWFNKDHL